MCWPPMSITAITNSRIMTICKPWRAIKLFALGEVGQLPDPDSYHSQPNWSWFMVWGYFINSQKTDSLPSETAVRRIYDDPRTLTLDEIDFSDGKYRLK